MRFPRPRYPTVRFHRHATTGVTILTMTLLVCGVCMRVVVVVVGRGGRERDRQTETDRGRTNKLYFTKVVEET